MTLEIVTYEPDHFDGVDSLWREAFPDDPPWNRAAVAVPEKLARQPDLLLVGVQDGAVVGTVMAGYDGHRGWLYAVAVRRSHRRRGIGARLVRAAEDRLRALGCRRINLQVRSSDRPVVNFYEAVGYAVEARVSLGKRIGPDAP